MKTLTKLFSFTLISIFMLSTNVFSYASSEVKVLVNDKLINFPDAKPFINEDDRTLVPVRFIAENLGCEVEWDGEIKQVGIKGKDKEIKLNIGQSDALVDDEKITFDTKAIIKEDRTFVPLRFVSEALGAKVEWDNDSRTVFISVEGLEDDGTAKVFIEPKIKLVYSNVPSDGYYFYLELQNYEEYINSKDDYKFKPVCTTHENLNFNYYRDIFGTGEWIKQDLADWRIIRNKIIRIINKNHYLTPGYDNKYTPNTGDIIKFEITFKNETKGISKTYYEEVEFLGTKE